MKPIPATTSPDPSAYQAILLGILGDDDPAEVQSRIPAELRSLVADPGPHLRLIAGHDRFHVDQARRTLEQVAPVPSSRTQRSRTPQS